MFDKSYHVISFRYESSEYLQNGLPSAFESILRIVHFHYIFIERLFRLDKPRCNLCLRSK
jgi:hypothetical protein